ncbi:MAG: bifunctional 5,10-methylenetetrahydrofolate dehydrogenase/5,10-methenyltetrahydrofolate cyclohydrolase [Fimbriimonas sp.]|jgi:methylenetetrahydrofolate dehydrogenase (NADP+)/methenyltetrahydrofolate cyclohydrolase|nr:bifunctional 5,10-methylenetetrahydrofolate dehydrogenase/5,10-methenyltetrahydrofolate cyclohydrolase [Fimbriimonas sp.]
MATILDGLALSKIVRAELAERVVALKAKGITPRLDVVVAAQDPASVAYVNMKKKWAAAAGMIGEQFEIDENTTQQELIDIIGNLNSNPEVHGVLLQHPLPKHLDEDAALLALGAEKDADGITPASLGRLTAGLPGFRCATPLGITKILDHYNIDVTGKRALVIGRSHILGKPMALMLLERNATVTIAHSKTLDLADRCREADILVAAVGRAEMVKGDWIKPGATVIDAGYNKVEGRKGDVGDVHFESAVEIAGAITPVPGGVGPMTVASLLSNAVTAAEKSVS